jgi:hypothetical protein
MLEAAASLLLSLDGPAEQPDVDDAMEKNLKSVSR